MAFPSRDETRLPSLGAIDLGEKDVSRSTSRTPSIAPAEGAQGVATTESPARAESPEGAHEFKPTWRFYLTFISLSVITLAAALDATSKSTRPKRASTCPSSP